VSIYETESGYQIVTDDASQEERLGYWRAGIGLQKVDGLSTSGFLHELADRNIHGLIGYTELEQKVIDEYIERDLTNAGVRDGFEADLVSARIARLLNENGFILSVATLQGIHRSLFAGLEPLNRNLEPGVFKTRDWYKKEPVLYGRSVDYGRAVDVRANLTERIEAEKSAAYVLPIETGGIARIASLTADIWEIHPFNEGNTRTVAVFIERYLLKMGFAVDNELFEHHSTYFRDALVRCCYMNAQAGITREPLFLRHFFENLLLDARHELPIRDLYAFELETVTK
jgi:fido (protein-threonine AMPylation protein)